MSSRLVILCPGQGGQHAAMFDLARSDRHAADELRRWIPDTMFGKPLDRLLGDDSLLFSNRIAQPLIVAATLATWEALKEVVPRPSLVAGYSIGEIAAYGVAGALPAADAVALAASRAKLMDACADASSRQSMIAVSGLSEPGVTELVLRHSLFIAIETGEDSFIVGGLSRQVAEFNRELLQLGGRTSALAVPIASHTPLMGAAVKPFAEVLGHSRFADPQVPVLSGIGAEQVDQKEQAIATLSRQLAEKIRWMDCMDACAEAGITVALELGPGRALSRMLQVRHAHIECRSAADFRTVAGIAAWLERAGAHGTSFT